MNQANKIKKTEKKILIFLLTTYAFIKKSIESFIQFFLNVGNQKVTVMFIPHSEKKVFNFRINIFILSLSILLSLTIFGIILFLTIDSSQKIKLYNDANLFKNINERRAHEYEEILNEIIENHTVFKSKLDFLLSQLDSTTIKALLENNQNNLNQGGPLNKIDTAEISEFDREKLEANKLMKDYQYSIQAFGEVNKMVESYNKLLVDLPFGKPCMGNFAYSSGFGFRIHPITKVLDMHTGTDLVSVPGTPITSTAPGTVEKVDWNPGGYGWYCKISHKLGFTTLYAHMRSQPIVQPGDKVKRGQIIGYMGSTGAATGTHVHYEVHLGDNLLDPWKFVSTF